MKSNNTKPYVQVIAELAAKEPERVAIYFEEQQLTIADLDRRSTRLAQSYRGLGVKYDDVVTLTMPNGIDLLLAILACWKLGALPNPISPSMPQAELIQLAERAKPALIVADNASGLDYTCVPIDFAPDAGWPDEPLPDLPKVGGERALASGGSTGVPKLIIPSNRAELDAGSVLSLFQAKNAAVVAGPLYHATPFTAAWQGILNGCTVVLMRRFDAEQFLQLIERHRVDRITLVPTMMLRIWNLPEDVRTRYDLSSLEMVISGGAPLPGWLMRAWIEWLGPDVMHEAYGPSERIGGTFINGHEWLRHPGSVGKPLPYCRIKILDKACKECPPGEIGEIYFMPVSGPGSTYVYRGTESRRTEDGWESVGDMGYLDDDGYLYLADRRADMIVVNGRNIYPAEIEGAIEKYPTVRSCAVIGLPDEQSEQLIHAIVDCEPGSVDDQALKTHLEALITPYKIPHRFEYVCSPLRNDAGKVRRSALREARLQTAR